MLPTQSSPRTIDKVTAARIMTSQDNIQDILQSVKIPCHPPNKSQWKKLEIAVKFINARETFLKRDKILDIYIMKSEIRKVTFSIIS